MNRSIACAPSSSANLGPGFDVFGLALDAFHDTVTLTKTESRVTIKSDDITTDPNKNTAGLVVKEMKRRFKIKSGIEITIKKDVPPGYGMGSSAASAAAAAVAFDRLFGLKLDDNSLVKFAGYGEMASAGSIHYDNVAASVLGGFVLVRTDPFDVIKIDTPRSLRACIGIPSIKVPEKKTKVSRGVMPKNVKLADSIANLSNASAMVAGFINKDIDLITSSITDVIAEPARKRMIPGFDAVKKNALRAGALAVTISGAGPSIIAFGTTDLDMQKIRRAIIRGFASAKTESRAIICSPSKGAVDM